MKENPVKEGKVAQNQQAKNESLLQAGYVLFTEQGIEETTINEITQRAGIGKGTFYIYYNDKYEIARAIIRQRVSPQISAVFDELYSEGDDDLQSVMLKLSDRILDYFAEDPEQCRFIYDYITLKNGTPAYIIPDSHPFLQMLSGRYSLKQINLLLAVVIRFNCYAVSEFNGKGYPSEFIKPRMRKIVDMIAAVVQEFD